MNDDLAEILAAARRGGCAEEIIERFVLDWHIGRVSRHRRATFERALRIQRLEAIMGEMDPHERCAAICTRLGISEATYFRARKVSLAT